jgi:protein SCO1
MWRPPPRCKASFAIPGLLAMILANGAGAAATGFEREAVDVSQAALGRAVGDLTLIDTDGEPRQLQEFFGRPLAISLVYTACAHSCSLTTRHLGRIVQIARNSLGDDSFTMLTVGFDTPVDNPETMRQHARRHGISDPNWFFLSSEDADGLGRLMADLGFVYRSSPRGFDHTVQVSVLDAAGRVYRQVYGETFEAPLLVEPLKDLVLGRPAPGDGLLQRLGKRVRLFCTVYDARGDRYVFDYSLFVGLFVGIAVLGLVIVWLGMEIARHRRRYSA